MRDVCSGGVSNYEQVKQSLLSANRWKSNFISLWKKYGTFQTVDDVKVLDSYRISGDGIPQKKMSILLRDKELWKKTQHEDIASVRIYFNLKKLVRITAEGVEQWRASRRAKIIPDLAKTLKFSVVGGDVEQAYFFTKELDDDGNVESEDKITNQFYVNLAEWVAEKKAIEAGGESTFSYTGEVNDNILNAYINYVSTYHTEDFNGDEITEFDVGEVGESVRSYLVKNSIGTDILDELVAKHGIKKLGGDDVYYLPLEAAKKMNGHVFIELVSKTLDFRIKKKGGFFRFLKRIFTLILAFIALYFQQYWLATSLLVGFVADETGSKFLAIASKVLAFMEADITSILDMGASEAINLLLNIYEIYITLEYRPKSGKDIEEDQEHIQNSFYRAPYDAYDRIYCYEGLITVKHDDAF